MNEQEFHSWQEPPGQGFYSQPPSDFDEGGNLILELLRTAEPIHIISIDNKNSYYDVSLKDWRLEQINKEAANHSESSFQFILGDIADKNQIDTIFNEFKPAIVVNLAAQAGVRYSITNPDTYIQSNLIGFYNILEACRHSYDNGETEVEHLVYASSSSVYGPAGRPDMAYFGFTNKLLNGQTI